MEYTDNNVERLPVLQFQPSQNKAKKLAIILACHTFTNYIILLSVLLFCTLQNRNYACFTTKKLHIWLQQPGGHVELHEDPLQALKHELLEETGLVLSKRTIIEPAEQPKVRGLKLLPSPFHFNVHNYNGEHKHIDLEYIVKSNTQTLTPDHNETQQIECFNLESLQKLLDTNDIYLGTYDICKWVLTKYV